MMMTMLHKLLIVLMLLVEISNVNCSDVSFEQVLESCCNEGNEWGSQGKQCSDYKFTLDNDIVPVELHGLCLSTVEICCGKQHRIQQCTAGSAAAKTSQSCDSKRNSFGTEFFKDCCEACKIGLVIGSSHQECSFGYLFGSPWDQITEECCGFIVGDQNSEDDTENETEMKNLCDMYDDLCSQICENTDKSYVCKCHEGYELLEDNITCIKKADATSNEIPSNETVDCDDGYKRNEVTSKCEDINECESDVRVCNIDTQVCYNTPGSYKCINILDPVEQDTQCESGYRYNERLDKCTDINECAERTDTCDRLTQTCLNTRGSFKCIDKAVEECLPGLKYNTTSKKCEDIDECTDPTACDEGYKCLNTVGSFECLQVVKKIKEPPRNSVPAIPIQFIKDCVPGYKLVNNLCVDVDECAYDKDACDVNQECINEIGGYRCDCKPGFQLDPVTNACEDINECQINNHECLETQRCDNTIGSYRCIRLQSCGTGYTFNAETGNCDDDDECVLNRHNCVEPYECMNTKGSFRCIRKPRSTTTTTTTSTTTTTTARPTPVYAPRYSPQYPTYSYPYYYTTQQTPTTYDSRYVQSQPCRSGFERNSLGACTDINECETRNPCARNQKCINTNGGYRCQNALHCQPGFYLNDDGTQCVDVDECETGEANCGPQQICKNKHGGYACVCPAGYISTQNRNCEDINECEFYRDRRPCPSNADCVNTLGSFRCECKSGFKNNETDPRMCIDVDECVEYPGLCQHRCVNYWGSYKCGCNSGYVLNENNRTCDDIDECELHKGFKLCMGYCENIPGSYQCACPAGYRLGTDNRSCDDIDECTDTPGICRGRDEVCTNLRGTYRCTSINCPYGYMRDHNKNRCKRIATICDRDDIECFRKPSSYSYNFISMIPNMTIPTQGLALFNLQTSSWDSKLQFDLKVVDVRAPMDIEIATERHFNLRNVPNGINLYLVRALNGPQDVELDLTMSVYTRSGEPSGSSVAKIFLLISEHPF